MSNSPDFLNQITSNLPNLATTKDLIEVGLFSSVSHATHCRKRGDCPKYISLSKKRILYPKQEVIAWLQKSIASGE